jgi:hypothetical protein
LKGICLLRDFCPFFSLSFLHSVLPFEQLAVSCSSALSPFSHRARGLVGPVTVSLPFRYESSSESVMKIGVS